MLSTCGTLAKLASLKSSHLPAMAKLALAVCQECEAECLKHADKHAACKACGEACAACAAECRKVAA
jgi:Cys-rich four helix bundle protein (predicted Tat secretion target)